jgi:hypothetical protein
MNNKEALSTETCGAPKPACLNIWSNGCLSTLPTGGMIHCACCSFGSVNSGSDNNG